jgi:hypothetical protein
MMKHKSKSAPVRLSIPAVAYITDTATRTGKSASAIASRMILAFADDSPAAHRRADGPSATRTLHNALQAMETVQAFKSAMAAKLRTLNKAVAAAQDKGAK